MSFTGGIGWDFPLSENKELRLRPIFNFLFGYIKSDASILRPEVEDNLDSDIYILNFLESGRINIYGFRGSLMLDWECYREDYEIDVELRYTNMQLRSFNSDYSSI